MQRTTNNRRAGFTLIELLAAIAILGIIYQMLPAVQKLREQANTAMAEKELKALASQIVSRGVIPASLEEIAPNGLDARNGFRLAEVEIKPTRLRLVSEPIPGVTGSQTGFLEVTRNTFGSLVAQVRFAPTPGADEGRRRMMSAVSSAVAQQFGRLAGWAAQDFHFRALAAVRSEIDNPLRQQELFASLRGTDGKVSLRSIEQWANNSDRTVRPSFSQMWRDVAAAMQLGTNSENIASLPGLSTLPAVQHSDKLLNFAVIADLTTQSVQDVAVRSKLLQFVNTAAAADKAGDAYGRKTALDGYTGELANIEIRSFSWGMSGGVAIPDGLVPHLRVQALSALGEALK